VEGQVLANEDGLGELAWVLRMSRFVAFVAAEEGVLEEQETKVVVVVVADDAVR